MRNMPLVGGTTPPEPVVTEAMDALHFGEPSIEVAAAPRTDLADAAAIDLGFD